MNKEELEKEAMIFYNTGSYPQIHPDHWAFTHGYVTGAEPREKRIAELEKELALSEHDREHNDYELAEVYKKVFELEKENAELKEENEKLKEHHKSVCEGLANTHRHIRERLNEGKEILSSLYFIIQGRIDYTNNVQITDEMWRAEQFLKQE